MLHGVIREPLWSDNYVSLYLTAFPALARKHQEQTKNGLNCTHFLSNINDLTGGLVNLTTVRPIDRTSPLLYTSSIQFILTIAQLSLS